MTDWKKDIKKFMEEFACFRNLSQVSNSDIMIQYYDKKGIKDDTSVKDWLIGLAEQKYPPYTTTLKYLKEIRNENALWKKEYQ